MSIYVVHHIYLITLQNFFKEIMKIFSILCKIYDCHEFRV